jgi:dipeptidyl aminopeptidase/acylaminoacyl peptidase
LKRAYEAYRAAQAGLINAQIALEFLLARVPEVDPARLFAAGHSSAGTMAILFAEHEPRLAGCVAYAPCVDLEDRFGPVGITAAASTFPGVREFLARFSPRAHESTLQCPLFLFHAEDDSNVPIRQSRDAAARLKALGKTVTLVTVLTGNHYDAMIRQGIPQGIEWMRRELAHPTLRTAPGDPPG